MTTEWWFRDIYMLYKQHKGLLNTAGMNKPMRVVALYHNKELSGVTSNFYPDSEELNRHYWRL